VTTGSDLKIVDEDIQRLHQDLKAISQAFTDDTRAAGDVGGAFGHQRLADEFSSFSESWRVNRERMQKNIDELATQMGNIKVATDEVDKALAGDGTSTDATSSTGSSSAGQGPAAPSGSLPPVATDGGGGQSGGASGSGATSPLPGASAGSDSATGSSGGAPDGSTTDPGTNPGDPGTDAADDTVVRVGEDGDFYASVTVGGAGAVGATATLMALYKLWDAHRAQISGDATPTSDTEQADARTRLLAGLEELGANGNDVTVELVSEGQSPDHVMAILRGEDGSVSVLDLSPDDAGNGAGAAPGESGAASDGAGAGAGEIVDGQPETPADTGTDDSTAVPVESLEGAGGGQGPAGGSAASSDPLPDVGSGSGGGGVPGGAPSAAAEPLSAVSSTDSGGATGASATEWSAGSVDVAGPAAESGGAVAVDSGDFNQDLRSPHVAGATAGMGMAGMGAVSAAGMGGPGGTSSRGQGEPLRKVQESADDEPEKEEQR
jgi:hypothetical protein